MLIAEVLKYVRQRPIYQTNPEKFANLEKSDSEIAGIAALINEGKREAENLQRTIELQSKLVADGASVPDLIEPGRRYIREGAMKFVVGDRAEELSDGHLFLFSNLLLVTRYVTLSRSLVVPVVFRMLTVLFASTVSVLEECCKKRRIYSKVCQTFVYFS
jgi:hypothetical protein